MDNISKDKQNKNNSFISKLTNKNKLDKSKDIVINTSIYKSKKNHSNNNNLNPENHPSKKNLTQSIGENEEKNNNNFNKNQTSNLKEGENAFEEKNNKQNEEGFEDDEISERNNTLKEKPDLNYYIKKKVKEEKQEKLQLSGEINQMMQSINKKNDAKLLQKESDEIMENNLEENNNKKKADLEEVKKSIEEEYIIHKKYIDKSTFFIILSSIGILLSLISCITCIYLQLYSNQDVLYIIGILSFFSIIIYIIWIIFILKDKNYVLFIINSRANPELILNSKYRKVIKLFLYLIILILNYLLVFMLVNTLYLNNTKLSIRGKAYDIHQWIEIFNKRNYSEIMSIYETSNIVFLVFGWLNYLVMLFIAIYQYYLLSNYRFTKTMLQLLCIFAIEGGIYQIYLSLHCYRFRDITSLESIKISWVTPGTISTGIVSILLGIFGFYVFFVENKKGIISFQIFCIVQWILLLVFTVSLRSIGDKFYSYKKATCNSLFKFISEDYLLKNKFNGCNSKYLFTTEILDNIECPKERIMINWERTESLYNDFDNNNDNENNKDNIPNPQGNNSLFFGCINQSCCLQIYFDIKNKFDLLFILSIHQTCFYIVLFFSCFYINCNINDNLDEEISEKINLLVFGIITLLIIVIILPFMVTLPKSSSQSKLNLIKNNEVSESLSILHKDDININLENLFKSTNESFNEIRGEVINKFKYNLVFDYLKNENFEYKLSHYEYSFVTEGLDIIIDNNILKKINVINFGGDFFENSASTCHFKTKINIINNIFQYFNFTPRNPMRNDLLLNVEINAIYSIKNEDDKVEETNGLKDNYENIVIYENDIINNYDDKKQYSLINIIKKEINFSIMNKTNMIYIKGNILNDDGNSVINVYNYIYDSNPIFSIKSESNGTFIIEPIYKLLKNYSPYYLSIEISKIMIYHIHMIKIIVNILIL